MIQTDTPLIQNVMPVSPLLAKSAFAHFITLLEILYRNKKVLEEGKFHICIGKASPPEKVIHREKWLTFSPVAS